MGLMKGGGKACFSGELPLRGADGKEGEKHALLRSRRCAGLMEGRRRSMLFWGASAARG